MWNSHRKANIFLAAVAVFSALVTETNANAISNISAEVRADNLTRIIGGSNVGSGEGTFVVRLVLIPSAECTGAIISRRHILTAAHCVKDRTGGYIYGGTVSRDDPNPIITQMARFFQHPQYGTSAGIYDIAVIEAARDLVLGGRQTSIPISSSPLNFSHRGTQFGWSQCKNPNMRDLQKLNVGFLERQPCRNRNGWYHYPETICVDPGATMTSCPGDSGGPVVSSGKIVGVHTSGTGVLGATINSQNVHHYSSWVKSVAGL